MIWDYFIYFAFTSIILWIGCVANLYLNGTNKKLTFISAITGNTVFLIFVAVLWIQLERPPLRTLGETRLWYALFSPFIGIVVYSLWKYKWFLTYSLFLASVFIIINVSSPENYSKTLMPALQSVWFVPHVIVYMFAYALLGASSIVAAHGLVISRKNNTNEQKLVLADNLVFVGLSFLTMGLIFGALWAKQAWGHYWTWDPKETWAFISWTAYLIYIHFRYIDKKNTKLHYWILASAFVILLICWFGVNYLPSAANSVHTYSN